MHVYSEEEGEKLVRAARHSIELFINSREFRNEAIERSIPGFTQKHGVFVSIYHYPTMTPRGHMGFGEGIGEVKKLLVEAAVSAASEDPKFVPVSHLEFDHIVIEVHILSKAERIHGNAEQLKKQIIVGRDGLMVEYGYHKGTLLPAEAREKRWSTQQFLDSACTKAGLPEHTWKNNTASLYKFSTQSFRENEPGGRVEEVKLEEA